MPARALGRRAGRYPNFASGWQTGVGDIFVGAKVNLASQADQKPAAFGVRGILKLPSASYDSGLGSGKVGFLADAIVSKEVNERVEVSGFAGFAARQSPTALDLPAGFRYGFGVAVPTRQQFRFTAEAFGEKVLRRHGDGG